MKSEIFRFIKIVIPVTILIYGPYIFLMSYGPITGLGPWEYPSILWVFIPVLIATALGLISVFFLFSKVKRRGAVMILCICAVQFVLFTPGVVLAESIRAEGFEMSKNRALPLVKAIESYKSDTGVLPSSLSVLFPSYLPLMPKGIPAIEIIIVHDVTWWLGMDKENCKGGKSWSWFVGGIEKCSFIRAQNYRESIRAVWFSKEG